MNPRTIRLLLILNALTALGAAAWTLATPSEAGAARLLGYSYARLSLAGACLLLAAGLGGMAFYAKRRGAAFQDRLARLEGWLLAGERLYYTRAALLGGWLLAGWCLLFTWLFIPANLRPLITWGLFGLFSLWFALRIAYKYITLQRGYKQRFHLLPSPGELDKGQKRVLAMLLGMALLAFLYFIPFNLRGAESMEAFHQDPSDEVVIYPILVDTLKPGETFSATLYHIFIYEDYHYGYPFYALSQLALLPVVLIGGADYSSRTQLNLLLLRQLVSVLPLLLAGLAAAAMATRLRSAWKAALLYLVILTAPGIYTYNIRFWHPDGLNALFVVLVVFFLARDRLRFGRDFYLAAVFCGLSIATRLYGVFFFLSVGGYLLAGLLQKRIRIQQALLHGIGFMAVMAAVLLLTSPYLFRADARGRMLEIMAEKSGEMRFGYEKPDPEGIYRAGWEAWLPFLRYYFAETFFGLFLLFSTASGFVFGRRRAYHGVIMGWTLALGSYLVYFVAVKSTQYLIPLFLPLYGGAFGFSEAAREGLLAKPNGVEPHPAIEVPPFTRLLADLVPAGFMLVQVVVNLLRLAGMG